MEDRKESNEWRSVPTFGDWDLKNGVPDYSMDFTKIREMRKQNKRDFSRASIGNDEELIVSHDGKSHSDPGREEDDGHLSVQQDHRPTTRKKILSYFNCCMIGT